MHQVQSSSCRDAMTILQDRWYNGVTRALGLSRSTFQLIQPAPPIAPNDLGLWSAANVLPPGSLTFNTTLVQPDAFFTDYAAVIEEQVFPQSTFEADIGADVYAAWTAYLATLSPQPTIDQLPAVFRQWASIYAPDVAAIGASDLATQAFQAQARQALAPYQGPDALPPNFSSTYAELESALRVAQGAMWTFDGAEESANVHDTWTGGADSGFFGVAGGVSSSAAVSRRFASSHVTVTESFKAMTTILTAPGGWYNSSVFNAAYRNPKTPPWPTDADPTWEETFGSSGDMTRFIVSLVVADGAVLTVESSASYSATDRALLQAAAAAGLWPLFSPSGGGVANSVTFGASRGMTMRTTIEPGSPFIVGANVLGVGPFLGGSP